MKRSVYVNVKACAFHGYVGERLTVGTPFARRVLRKLSHLRRFDIVNILVDNERLERLVLVMNGSACCDNDPTMTHSRYLCEELHPSKFCRSCLSF